MKNWHVSEWIQSVVTFDELAPQGWNYEDYKLQKILLCASLIYFSSIIPFYLQIKKFFFANGCLTFVKLFSNVYKYHSVLSSLQLMLSNWALTKWMLRAYNKQNSVWDPRAVVGLIDWQKSKLLFYFIKFRNGLLHLQCLWGFAEKESSWKTLYACMS